MQVATSLSQITADHIATCKEFELEETSAASATAQVHPPPPPSPPFI